MATSTSSSPLEILADAVTTLVCGGVLVLLALMIVLQATTVPEHCADMTPREANAMCASTTPRH